MWAALDADTRQVVAMVVGDRSEDTARRLWAALPAAHRDRAARFVRKALSFSKCERNHVGALWYFIRLDNRSRRCRP